MLMSLALLLAAAQPPAQPYKPPSEQGPLARSAGCRPMPPPPAADEVRIARLSASATALSAETAIRVRSVHDEYEILGALRLCSHMQALVQRGGHPYDVLTAIDPITGFTREFWFDISSFFGHEF
jgi:hypothetical protein